MRNFRFYSVAIVASALLVVGGCSRVGGDWKAAQAADTSEAYQDFLHQHPDSEFTVQAQARIKQLSEDKDWQAASAADTPDAYEQFVAAHADSKWAQEARVRIENFQQSKTPPGTPRRGRRQRQPAGPGAPPPPAALQPTTAAPKPAKRRDQEQDGVAKSASSSHAHTPLAQLGRLYLQGPCRNGVEAFAGQISERTEVAQGPLRVRQEQREDLVAPAGGTADA